MTSNQTSAQEIGSWMRQKANTLAPAAREVLGLAHGGATIRTHQSPPHATSQKRARLRHSRKASNQRTALAICCRVQQKPSAPTPARREAPELAHAGEDNQDSPLTTGRKAQYADEDRAVFSESGLCSGFVNTEVVNKAIEKGRFKGFL